MNAILANSPTHLPSYFTSFDDIRHASEACFERFDDKDNLPKLRFFYNNGRRCDYELKLLQNGKPNGLILCDWIKRTIGVSGEYCTVVNDVTKWCEVIHDFIYDKFIHDYVRVLGTNMRACSAYLIAGEYDMTPFGIHYDLEDSILFQLGPSPKTAYYWPDYSHDSIRWSDILKINRYSFDEFPTKPTQITLAPGDLLYLPRGCPHVMASGGYSVTLGVSIQPSSLKDAIFIVLDEALRDDDHSARSADHLINLDNCIDEIGNIIRTLSSRDSIATALLVHYNRMRSNGWITPAPALKQSNKTLSCLGYSRDLRYPFCYVVLGDKIKIFSRGKSIEVPFCANLESVLCSIQEGEVVHIEDFQSAIRTNFTKKAAEKLFDKLVIMGALCVTQ